jgi:hypothetical protein
MQTVSEKIRRLLAKYNIKTVHQPVKKTNNTLRLVNDNLGQHMLNIHHTPCECGKVNVSQTGHTITARCKEYECHIQLHRPEKPVVVMHCLETSQKFDFGEVTVPARSTGYMDRLVKEATEI